MAWIKKREKKFFLVDLDASHKFISQLVQVALCLQLYIGRACAEKETNVVLAVHLAAQEDLQDLQGCLQKETIV